MNNHKPCTIFTKAKDEFKKLFEQEFDEPFLDQEVYKSAGSVLHLFALLTKGKPAAPHQIKVTENEWRALRYIHDALFHRKSQPTVRGVAVAIGCTSSRSGLRMLRHLISFGFVSRDRLGKIVMNDAVSGCDTQFLI
jgi:hypothetical protein